MESKAPNSGRPIPACFGILRGLEFALMQMIAISTEFSKYICQWLEQTMPIWVSIRASKPLTCAWAIAVPSVLAIREYKFDSFLKRREH